MNNLQNSAVKIGVSVFLIKDGKVLFGKRIGKTGYGTWCLPGGHFEYGESLAGAAKRELKEETGIAAGNVEFLHIINDVQYGDHYVHINFFVKDFKGEAMVTEPDKFAEWKWFLIDDLPKNIFAGHQKFMPAYKKQRTFLDDE